MSFLSHLVCHECHKSYDANHIQTFCPGCKSPLFAQYDIETARKELDRDSFTLGKRGMWRWHELLPIINPDSIVSLGEGDTPLLHLPRLGSQLSIPYLYAKDEGINPTGSFKARGLSSAISKAKELGIKNVVIPSAGNAGGALAAYAARAGMSAFVFMPNDTPPANIIESRIAGATVILVPGNISDAAALAGRESSREGWYDLSTFKEPYRTEGKKIMGYELAEAFHWVLPDVIIYPTGGGTGLVGMWKAFAELSELGWLESDQMPKMIAVQSSGCAPVVEAYNTGSLFCNFWADAQTIASGLRVPKSFADKKIMQDLRESNGSAIAVSDEEIIAAQKWLATTEGIFAAPEGAATLAGLSKLKEAGNIQGYEKIVIFITGSGLKYLDLA